MFRTFNSKNRSVRKTQTEKYHGKCQKHKQTLHRGGNIYGQLIHEEIFSIISHQENANQYYNNMPIHLAKHLISDNANY